jgi:hypothetical protein
MNGGRYGAGERRCIDYVPRIERDHDVGPIPLLSSQVGPPRVAVGDQPGELGGLKPLHVGVDDPLHNLHGGSDSHPRRYPEDSLSEVSRAYCDFVYVRGTQLRAGLRACNASGLYLQPAYK